MTLDGIVPLKLKNNCNHEIPALHREGRFSISLPNSSLKTQESISFQSPYTIKRVESLGLLGIFLICIR